MLKKENVEKREKTNMKEENSKNNSNNSKVIESSVVSISSFKDTSVTTGGESLCSTGDAH